MPDVGRLRAAVYARVSTDDQVRDGTSLAVQRERGIAYVALNEWILVDEFVDEGISGSKASRPALDRLMIACRSGDVDVVVVTKLDRFGRSTRHLTAALGELDELKIAFISIAESFDSTSPSGRLQRNMLASFAEFEREQIRDRMMSGQRAMAMGGFWPGGPAPHGYRIIADGAHKRLELNEAEATPIGIAIAIILDEGGTVGDATRRLNAMGYSRRKAVRWNRTHLRRRLLLEHWSGTWVWHKSSPDPVVISIPPLLSPERHAQLRLALAGAMNASPRSGVKDRSYPLSLRMFGTCGAPYSGVFRQDRDVRYYRCRNRNVHAVDGGTKCDDKWLRSDETEAIVWQSIRNLLEQPERLMTMARDYLGLRGEQVTIERSQIAEVEARIAQVEGLLNRKVGEYLRAGVDAKAVKAATEELTIDLEALGSHRDSLNSWREANTVESERMRSLWELADVAHYRLGSMSPSEMKDVLKLLDVKVTVLGHIPCALCNGRGRIGGKGVRGQPSCPDCHGTGSNPELRIEGTVNEKVLLRELASDHGDPTRLVRRGRARRAWPN